ncbi:site-specific integrase [Saprospiraceae bacterium]|nr:site-specific integrase [Saprospiraceae bacterium]
MATVNFYLKDKNFIDKKTLVYMFFSYNGKRLKYSTGEKVLPKEWKEEKQIVKSSVTGSLEINQNLRDLENYIFKIYREHKTTQGIPTPSFLRTSLNNKFKKDQSTQDTFFDIYDKFIETTKSQVKSRTTQKYTTLKNHLLEFEKHNRKKITCDDIDINFYEQLHSYYLNELKLLNNTIGKYISTFKTFMTWATDREFNSKIDYLKFKAHKEDADIVYLEEKELMKLYHFDLSQNLRLAQVRDTFCLGCFTGLRFSDLENLKPKDIRNNKIIINTFKTRETLQIPLNRFAKEIIAKYSDEPKFLHIISNQKMNVYLKEVCKMAKINTPITLTKYRGVERIEITQPKHKFISTHTARRTFVTLSLEKGMRPEIVMKITGHKAYKTFKKYIKITDKVKGSEMKRVWDS